MSPRIALDRSGAAVAFIYPRVPSRDVQPPAAPPPLPPYGPRPYGAPPAWAPPRRYPQNQLAILVVVIVLIVVIVGALAMFSVFGGVGGGAFLGLFASVCALLIVIIVVVIIAAMGGLRRTNLPPPPPVQQPMVPAGTQGPIALSCPNCGAPPVNVDRFGVATCTYCGTRFLVR